MLKLKGKGLYTNISCQCGSFEPIFRASLNLARTTLKKNFICVIGLTRLAPEIKIATFAKCVEVLRLPREQLWNTLSLVTNGGADSHLGM
jgi:hypothetical protein